MASIDLATFLDSALGSYLQGREDRRRRMMEDAQLAMQRESHAAQLEGARSSLETDTLQRQALQQQLTDQQQTRARAERPTTIQVPEQYAPQMGLPNESAMQGPLLPGQGRPYSVPFEDSGTVLDRLMSLQQMDQQKQEFGLRSQEAQSRLESVELERENLLSQRAALEYDMGSPYGERALADYIEQSLPGEIQLSTGHLTPRMQLLKMLIDNASSGMTKDPRLPEYQKEYEGLSNEELEGRRSAYLNVLGKATSRGQWQSPEQIQRLYQTYAPQGTTREQLSSMLPTFQSEVPGEVDWLTLLGGPAPVAQAPAAPGWMAPTDVQQPMDRETDIYRRLRLLYPGKGVPNGPNHSAADSSSTRGGSR